MPPFCPSEPYLVLAVRGLIFALAWMLAGQRLWLLPNLLSDEVPLDHVFTPVWGVDNGRDGSLPPPKFSSRLVVAAGTATLCWALWRYAPENSAGRAARGFRRSHDAVLEMLHLMRNSSRVQLPGEAPGNASSSAAANFTQAGAAGANATHGFDAGASPPPGNTSGEAGDEDDDDDEAERRRRMEAEDEEDLDLDEDGGGSSKGGGGAGGGGAAAGGGGEL